MGQPHRGNGGKEGTEHGILQRRRLAVGDLMLVACWWETVSTAKCKSRVFKIRSQDPSTKVSSCPEGSSWCVRPEWLETRGLQH